MTIEDETGVCNVVVWPSLFEKQRRIVLGTSMMAINGKIQREGVVVHLVAQRLFDFSGDLASLGERDTAFRVPTGRGDEFAHGSPGSPDSRDRSPLGVEARDILVPGFTYRYAEGEKPEFSVISTDSYRGDTAKSKATGTLSADAVNAHADANLIRRTLRAWPSFHSYAMLSPPSGN